MVVSGLHTIEFNVDGIDHVLIRGYCFKESAVRSLQGPPGSGGSTAEIFLIDPHITIDLYPDPMDDPNNVITGPTATYIRLPNR